MRRPLLSVIIDEINDLFSRAAKGKRFNQDWYARERNKIIRKHGYTPRAFKRIALADYYEKRQEGN